MQPGSFLVDHARQEQRFQIKSLLSAGKNYQIALAQDTHLEGKLVCVKTIEYDVEHIQDPRYVQGRRQALKLELEFLAGPHHMLPEPLDWIEVSESLADAGPEPLLIYEYQHGQTLYEMMREKHPKGMNPNRALRIFAELVKFTGELHAQGYLFRDFDPRHLIVGFDDIIHVVGCGNAVPRDEKLNVYKMNTNPAYTAPEIRREISGAAVRPACDFYSLGALLTFMLTGIEPLGRVEAPLDVDAYEALKRQAPGLQLLIARCMQPLGQKRFNTAAQLLAFCDMERLPGPTTEGFALMALPQPWDGPEGMDNASLRSKLSPGPLISQRNPEAAAPAPAQEVAQPTPQAEIATQGAQTDALVKAPEQQLERKPDPQKQKGGKLILIALLVMIMFAILAAVGALGVMGLGLMN